MSGSRLLELDFARADLPLVRASLAASLRRAGLREPTRSSFTQAVLEVVANAVVHGGGAGRLSVSVTGGEVRCTVTDSGPGPSAEMLGTRAAESSATGGGHGLLLAEALAGRLDVHPGVGGRGTAVALAVALNPPAGSAH